MNVVLEFQADEYHKMTAWNILEKCVVRVLVEDVQRRGRRLGKGSIRQLLS